MPKVTRWFIKAGIFYFIVGVILALISEFPAINAGPLLLPVYWHMLVIGWLTQIIMGVSIWMFPRKQRDKIKRESTLTWLTFWTLNSGLILRFLAEPFLPVVQDSFLMNVVILFSSLLQISAVIFYIIEIWPRLQPRKKRKRSRS